MRRASEAGGERTAVLKFTRVCVRREDEKRREADLNMDMSGEKINYGVDEDE